MVLVVSSSSLVNSGRSTSRLEVHIYKFPVCYPLLGALTSCLYFSNGDQPLEGSSSINSPPGMFCLNLQRLVAPVLYIG